MRKLILIVILFVVVMLGTSFLRSEKVDPITIYTGTVFTPQTESKFVEVEQIVYNELELPEEADGKFKTYMDYRKITDKSSKQWELQQLAWTEERGFRKIGEHFLVAVGTFYADEVGKELLIEFEDGQQIKAIVGDIKQDRHTDPTNRYVPINGNIVEFIVDVEKLDPEVIRRGDVSWLGLNGKITSIWEVERYARKMVIR
ncbi:MAG TPA: hypothetical protein PKI14_17130 [Fervidobacterium sp.]|nr:hypothetical protein [Fervidobacterium sp.]